MPLLQLLKESLKKFRLVQDSNPWPLRYWCSALTSWANKPTGSRSLNWFVINLWKDDDEVMNIWQSYMRTAGSRIMWKKIITVIDTTFPVTRRKPVQDSNPWPLRYRCSALHAINRFKLRLSVQTRTKLPVGYLNSFRYRRKINPLVILVFL